MSLRAVLPILLAVAGFAAAQQGLTVERTLELPDFATAQLRASFAYDEATSRQFRELSDADHDGRISPEEREANEGPYAHQLGAPGDPAPWTLDGIAYVRRGDAVAHSRGLEGRVDQAGIVHVAAEAAAALNGTVRDGPSHALVRSAVPHEALEAQETVRAPKGWRFLSAEGIDTADICSALIPASQRGEVRLSLQPDDGTCERQARGGPIVPGPEAALLALGLGAAALLAARRR